MVDSAGDLSAHPDFAFGVVLKSVRNDVLLNRLGGWVGAKRFEFMG